MLKARFLLFFCLILFLGACSTNVSLRVDRAPQVKIHDVQKIAVHKFGVSGDFQAAQKSKTTTLEKVVKIIKVVKKPTATKNRNKEFQSYNKSGLENTLANHGYYTVVKKGAGQDAIITGNIDYSGIDDITSKKVVDSLGNTRIFYTLTRKVTVTTMFDISDNSKAKIGSSQASSTYSASFKSRDPNVSIDKIEAWDGLVKKGIARNWQIIAAKITPYSQVVRRTLAKGDSKVIKQGNKYAGYGDWDGALNTWEKAKNGTSKDRSAYLYNKSLYKWAKGDLESSLDFLQQAYEVRRVKNWFHQIKFLEHVINEQNQYDGLERKPNYNMQINKNNTNTLREDNYTPASGPQKAGVGTNGDKKTPTAVTKGESKSSSKMSTKNTKSKKSKSASKLGSDDSSKSTTNEVTVEKEVTTEVVVENEKSTEVTVEKEKSNNGNQNGEDEEKSNNGNQYGKDKEKSNNGNQYGKDKEKSNNGNHYGQDKEKSNNGNHYGQDKEKSNNGNHYGQEKNETKSDADEELEEEKPVYKKSKKSKKATAVSK